MQYFSKLPKINFESTIGSFKISDFFTYIDPNSLSKEVSSIEYDNENTLVEAASSVYGDPDSFWIFCLLTENYNPFTLNKANAKKEKENLTTKLNIGTTVIDKGSTYFVPPKGSFVVPYISNSGSSASFSSIGNFNVNGGFALVENDFYYSRSSILKDLKVNTSFIKEGLTGTQFVIINQSSTGGYSLQNVYLDSVEKALEKVAYTYDTSNAKTTGEYKTYSSKIKANIIDETVSKTATKYSGVTTVDSVTYDTVFSKQINTIPAYPANYVSDFTNKFVTTKYY